MGELREQQSPVRAFHIGKTARAPYGVGFNRTETVIVKKGQGCVRGVVEAQNKVAVRKRLQLLQLSLYLPVS